MDVVVVVATEAVTEGTQEVEVEVLGEEEEVHHVQGPEVNIEEVLQDLLNALVAQEDLPVLKIHPRENGQKLLKVIIAIAARVVLGLDHVQDHDLIDDPDHFTEVLESRG